MGLGLHPIQNPMGEVTRGYEGVARTMGGMSQRRKVSTEEGKTAGGALSAGLGGAVAGLSLVEGLSLGASAGPPGMAIGAGIGLLSYLF